MKKRVEKVGLEAEKILYQKLEATIEDKIGKNEIKGSKLKLKYDNYKMGNLSAYVNKGLKVKEMTYDMLPEFLAIEEHNLKDFFTILGVDIPKEPKEIKAMIKYLNNHCNDDLDKLEAIVKDNSLEMWFTKENENDTITVRIHKLIINKIHRWKRRKIDDLPESVAKSWKDQHGRTTVSYKDFPKVASYFNVSLHWLMNMPYSTLCYCKNEQCERIMEYFFFVPLETKKAILMALNEEV